MSHLSFVQGLRLPLFKSYDVLASKRSFSPGALSLSLSLFDVLQPSSDGLQLSSSAPQSPITRRRRLHEYDAGHEEPRQVGN